MGRGGRGKEGNQSCFYLGWYNNAFDKPKYAVI